MSQAVVRQDLRRVPRERVLCVLATVAALAPFLRKPFHIDDPLFVWTARRIHEAPLDFYGFLVNWTGVPHLMSEFMRNPPLTAYWHALVAAIGGFGELSLHLGALPFAVASTLGSYELARRFCTRPLLATLVGLAAPTFLVSATSVGSDVPMLAAWLWAIVLWVRGLDERRPSLLAWSGLLCGIAALTKYFAVGLIPLLAVYSLTRDRRAFANLAWLGLPALMILAYEMTTAIAYGRGLLLEAVSFSYGAGAMAPGSETPALERAWIGLLFVGGSVFTTGLFAPFVWSRRALAIGCAIAAAGAVLAGIHGSIGMLPLQTDGVLAWAPLLHIAVFSAIGLHVVAAGVRDLRRHEDPDSLLLGLALAGTIAFGLFFNWTVNARSLIALAPISAILTLRGLESSRPGWVPARPLLLGAALLAGASVALAVTWADWQLAWTHRAAAEELTASPLPGQRVRFLGHWGFQYYAEAQGARAVDFADDRLEPGDLLVVPENNSASNRVPWALSTLVQQVEVTPSPFLSVQSWETRAGFHAAVRGPLPFYVGRTPPERFVSVRMKRPMKSWAGVLVPAN